MDVCCRLTKKCETLLSKASAEELAGFPQAGWASGGEDAGQCPGDGCGRWQLRKKSHYRNDTSLSYQKTTRQTGRNTRAQGN